ncbi:MAG TPA: [Fe-Fe] hydrogenase large subunit C-terminal domain-containing protein [Candidatus Eremiobacteraeota bacterium]|nr:[Fe-Fe] hydrogenase large subunit C-terminal domain-containing protein [Candidatus Eremiobacteraeota bacterium]
MKGVMEVAYGADVATIRESEEWYNKIYKENQPFLGTSCCPAWVDMARRLFPDMAGNISDSYTPMVATGRFIKEKYPGSLVTFIGPCIAKKAESLRPEMSPFVDFVITYEEEAAIFVSLDIDLVEISEKTSIYDASGSGRHYATSGGVAEALKLNIVKFHPECSVKIAKADSLEDCKKMLFMAKAGKVDANLLEGMACPHGCVGGPGILAPIKKTAIEVEKFSKKASFYPSYENSLLR